MVSKIEIRTRRNITKVTDLTFGNDYVETYISHTYRR